MGSKMKILYLHQYFNTPDMAGGTRSYEMARRLVAAGHEVHMITSWKNETERTDWFESEVDGINVHWLPVPYANKMAYRDRVKAFFKFALQAGKKARSIGGDLVFATSTPLTIAIPGVNSARALKVPMVFEVRDLWPELPIAIGALKNPLLKIAAKKLERWAYKNSSAIIALSPGMEEGILKSGYPKEKVTIIPNGCDNQLFSANDEEGRQFREDREWLGDRPLVLYAGALGKINGVGYLADIAKETREINPEVCFLVIGEGAEEDLIRNHAKSLGVYGENFFMEGRIRKKDMPAAMKAADISSGLFIDLPEMRANSSNKFFDALSSGTPVLINYGGWHHDLVADSECGINAWNREVHEVAEEICRKIVDGDWKDKAGNGARKLAEEQFDRDKLAACFEKVLMSVL